MTTAELAFLSLTVIGLTELLFIVALCAWCLKADARKTRRPASIPAQRRAQVVAAHPAGGRDRDAWAQVSGQTATITQLRSVR